VYEQPKGRFTPNDMNTQSNVINARIGPYTPISMHVSQLSHKGYEYSHCI